MASPRTGRPRGRPRKLKSENTSSVTPPQGTASGDGGFRIPSAPKKLGVAGRKLWKTLWTEQSEFLTESDAIVIETAALLADEIEDVRDKISNGEVDRFYVTANGQVVTHPLVNQLKDLRTQLMTYLTELGTTPQSRAKLQDTERVNTGIADAAVSIQNQISDVVSELRRQSQDA